MPLISADSSSSRLIIRPETAFAETPGAPGVGTHFQDLRFTSQNFKHGKATVASDEINSTRSPAQTAEVGVSANGTVGFEFSALTYDALLAAMFCGTWTGSGPFVLVPGTTRVSYAAEVGLTDIAKYFIFKGLEVNTMSMDITSRQIVKGDFGFMGSTGGVSSGTSIDSAIVAKTTTAVMAAGVNVGSVQKDGGAFPDKIRRLTWNATNNMRERTDIAALASNDYGLGELQITGSVETYFKDQTVRDAYIAHTPIALSYTFADTAWTYLFEFLRAQITDYSQDVAGKNNDVAGTFSFACETPASGPFFRITRTAV